jgi:hypothetical protein
MHNQKYMLLAETTGEEGGGGQTNFTPEEIAARLSVAEGTYDPEGNIINKDDVDDEPVVIKDKPVDTPPQTYVASPIWDVLKADEGFTMPENITAENEQELIKPFLAKKYGFEQPELHPLAKQIQEMASTNPNLTINDLVNTVSSQFVDASKMTADEKISFDLLARYGEYDAEKNPDGYTKEDIDEYISKLSKVEKNELAKSVEIAINDYNKKLTDDYKEQNQKQFEAQYESIVTQTKEAVSKLKLELSKVESVFGVPVSQEQHLKYLEEFERVVIPDKATGERGLDKILSNDMLLYKAYLIMAKFGEEKVIEIMTKGRESAKEELLKKLEITPGFGGNNVRENVDHKNIDYAKAAELLSIPQQ